MNQKEKELCELPEWVKLVNRIMKEKRGETDEKRDFDRGSGT